MSAITPKADIDRARQNVRFVQKADSCSAANHTIPAQPKPGGIV